MSHMTLDDRILIQEGLDKNLSIRVIAKQIGKSPSTVLREINKHRHIKGKRYEDALEPCSKRSECQIVGLCKNTRCYYPCRNCSSCKTVCPHYSPGICEHISKSPYVCNGCSKQNTCTYSQAFYFATYAHNSYKHTLISCREGVNLTPEELQAMDNLVSPLIRKGQPVNHILANHADEIICSRTTLYSYIEKAVLTARNIDLPRKVKYKKRTNTTDKIPNEIRLSILSRNYERFTSFISKNPDLDVVEMDTVVGPVGSKTVLLTLLFRSCNLMLAIILPEKTQENVIAALNRLSDELGIELFRKLFPVILTDRGTEFLNPEAIECDSYGEVKTRLFYCDPQASWQKGALEKNHEFIRYVLPKGTSFDHLEQADITLMVNHINSISREKYHGMTPYKLSCLFLDKKLHQIMNLLEIPADELTLKPSLLRRIKG